MTISLILWIVAAVLFLLAALNVNSKVSLGWLGAFLASVAVILAGVK